MNVGYFRNWWGNWYVVDNRATSRVGLHAVQHRGAGRSAAAGRRRPDDQRPVQPRPGARSGRSTSSRSTSKQLRGADRELARRGCRTSSRGCGTGSRCRAARAPGAGSRTACALGRCCRSRAPAPTARTRLDRRRLGPTNPYCRVVEPYLTRDQGARDVYDSQGGRPGERDVASNPGAELAANYVATNAVIAAGPQPLGRDSLGGAANVTVNLIQPGTLYARSAEQPRLPRREDPPVRPDADAGRARPLQRRRTRTWSPATTRRSSPTDRVADADGDSAGAVRQGQRAVRLLKRQASRLRARSALHEASSRLVESEGPVLVRGAGPLSERMRVHFLQDS